jgi:hypothetical protein
MSEPKQKFESWAILEVMGHQKFAGLVTEETIAGTAFIRIDIPAADGKPKFTKLFGGSTIYCLTPVTEDVARAFAAKLRTEPITKWDIPDDWIPKLNDAPLLEGVGDIEPEQIVDIDYQDEEF